MKKKLTIIGLLGFTFLFGCAQTQDKVGASDESEFSVVSKQELGSIEIYKVKHNDSGCYYIATRSYQQGGGITQMHNRHGSPYCD